MSHPTTLVWFRQDLRLQDNPALYDAAQQGSILPIYILDDSVRLLGGASRWWLHHSLRALNSQLNNQLRIFKGNAEQILINILKDTGIQRVHWNRCYEPDAIARDKGIKQALKDMAVEVQSFQANLLWEPWNISKGDGSPFKVFTPYYKNGCLKAPSPRFPLPKPEFTCFGDKVEQQISLDGLDLIPDIPWYKQMAEEWQPGSDGAAKKLQNFLQGPVKQYKADRDIPGQTGTSRLSPHLHFGEISPNQIWYAVQESIGQEQQGAACYLSEIGWREFSYYLLFHFPHIETENFNPKFAGFPWHSDPHHLQQWQKGKTGIPIVDAGMRELWQTGYMHNRVRMIVASFLTKNLLIDWRKGEEWFWDCLLDADMASNTASWQWVAGCGADAAPYFRIFNPVLQGQKFDKQGAYVKQYCPELSQLPDKYLHNPWEAPENILQQANVRLGDNYPEPIVDLKGSRERALHAYQQIKQQD